MKTGMLWRGDDTCTLAQNIGLAASYYQRKYKQIPDTCYVPLNEKKVKIKGMNIYRTQCISPRHIWMGRKGE